MAQRTPTALQALVDSNLADNVSREITEQDVRDLFTDVVDSTYFRETDAFLPLSAAGDFATAAQGVLADSALQSGVGLVLAASTKTSDYTVLSSDFLLVGDATSGDIAFTLPPASSVGGQIFNFKKKDSTTNSIIMQGSETIDGVSSISVNTQYESLTMQSDAAEWWVI